jgi:3-hydroxy-9,10-secoandrosta-1,3,5(10)-triene-9,17-dione monooxygenase reductase component
MIAIGEDPMIDPQHFRKSLSAYPTGICVITATAEDGLRHAMVVGSFTSISLDPPLIGFFPAKSSSSWAAMKDIGHFTVNVLGASQLAQCKQFARSGADKFGDLVHGISPGGHPLIEGSIAWMDCSLDAIHEIGDHYLVVGRVNSLDGDPQAEPLLFFGGAYHRIGEMAQ